MNAQEDDKLDKILKEIGKINRGLYGDAENKVPGLMQNHYELKEDVVKLKEGKKKLYWMVGGFVAAVEAFYFIWKEIGH